MTQSYLGRIQAQLVKAAEELRHRGWLEQSLTQLPQTSRNAGDFENLHSINLEGWQAAVGD
jgi:hypothetical protein